MKTYTLVLTLALLVACGAPGGGVTSVPTTTCPSGKQWTGGDSESPLMHPGLACIACHTSRGEGPRFAAAGTVYRDLNEADDCGGADLSGLSVVITGADATVHTLPVNAMGNFYLEGRSIAAPFSAKVVDAQGGVREMQAKQTDGDCNSCHTKTGTQAAPGRIIAP